MYKRQLLQERVVDRCGQRQDGRAADMTDLGLFDARQGLEALLHAGLAVAAHHTFDLHRLFHGIFLLVIFMVFSRRNDGLLCVVLPLVVVLRAADAEQVQAQGVRHDAEARKAHRRRAEHRVHLPAEQVDPCTGGKRDADDIVEKCPEQILVDIAQRSAAQADGSRNIEQAALHEHDVRRVDGDVRACADGDAGVRARQGGGVVDAVADHGDLALLLQAANDGLLAVRQDARDDLVHTGLRADGLCRALVIARQPVSYTHLDVYKRQAVGLLAMTIWGPFPI